MLLLLLLLLLQGRKHGAQRSALLMHSAQS
jgi:hypothetical protein